MSSKEFLKIIRNVFFVIRLKEIKHFEEEY